MQYILVTAATLLAAAQSASPVWAQVPSRIGASAATTITRIGDRFNNRLVRLNGNDLRGGMSILLRNGVYGMSSEYVADATHSRIGDPVVTCLVSVPRGCSKGDDRGRVYRTTNTRTQASWKLSNAPHICGEAWDLHLCKFST